MESLKEVDVHRNLDRSLYYKGKAANLRMLNTLLPKMQRQRQNDIDVDKDRQTFNHQLEEGDGEHSEEIGNTEKNRNANTVWEGRRHSCLLSKLKKYRNTNTVREGGRHS